MELFLASRNNYKIEQFRYLLQDTGVSIKTIADFGFNDDVDECGASARENALIKARFWQKKVKMPTLADDAGLEIDALSGEPGVKARRWGGLFEGGVSDKEWLSYLLKRMEGVPFAKRSARYRAAWALVLEDGREVIRDIVLEFLIAEKPKENYPAGSPMSAVRFFKEYGKIEVDLSKEEQWRELLREMKEWDVVRFLK